MIPKLTSLDFGMYNIYPKSVVFAFIASTVQSGESRTLHLRVLINFIDHLGIDFIFKIGYVIDLVVLLRGLKPKIGKNTSVLH